MTSQLITDNLIENLLVIARSAGHEILEIYRTDFSATEKSDLSPVTQADVNAEAIILRELALLTPDIPVVSEEAASDGQLPKVGQRFWLVDPLDGTKEFINRNGEFTVNIALIENGVPVMGVVYAPTMDRLYAGAQEIGSFIEEHGNRRSIACRRPPNAGLTVVASRSHGAGELLNDFLEKHAVSDLVNAGSSIKLCMIACGDADAYPRFGRTMEWDIAAGDALLRAAGGIVLAADGSPMKYGKSNFENPYFIAWGSTPFTRSL